MGWESIFPGIAQARAEGKSARLLAELQYQGLLGANNAKSLLGIGSGFYTDPTTGKTTQRGPEMGASQSLIDNTPLPAPQGASQSLLSNTGMQPQQGPARPPQLVEGLLGSQVPQNQQRVQSLLAQASPDDALKYLASTAYPAPPTWVQTPEGGVSSLVDKTGRVINQVHGGTKDDAHLKDVVARFGPDWKTNPAALKYFDEITKPASVTMNTTLPPAPRAYDETKGKADAEALIDINKAAVRANSDLNNVDRLDALLSSVDTGSFKGTTADLKARAKAFGVDLDALGIKDDAAPVQAAQAASRAMALQLRNPAGGAGMPGAMSDADRNYLESMVAGVDKQPGANAEIIDASRKVAQRAREVSTIANKYTRENGGRFDQSGFADYLAKWSDQNPLFPKAKQNQPAPQQTPGVQPVAPIRRVFNPATGRLQ